MIKKEKGITLVALIITIVLMLIIAGTTVNVSYKRFEINKVKKLINDIELLDDKVANYYLEYNGLPVVRNENNNPIEYILTEDNGSNYYILDLEVIGELSLNYGKDFELVKNSTQDIEQTEDNTDIYIINQMSKEIYYVKGIELNGNIYHTLSSIKINEDDFIPPTKPQIKVISGETKKVGEETIYISDVYLEIIPGNDSWSGIKETVYKVNDGEELILSEANNILQLTEAGEYNITVTSYDNSNNRNASSITSKIVIQKSSIILSSINLLFEIGEEEPEPQTLTATVEDIDSELIWKVEPEDSGITISGEGNTKTISVTKVIEDATITVSCGEISATCKVTAKEVPYIILDKYEESVEIEHGNTSTIQLTATLNNADGDLTWTSSDTNIAEISGEGNTRTITAKSAGTVNITVSFEDVKKECIITVIELPYITLDKTQIAKEITTEQSTITEELTATLHNATGDLTWESSDESIAEISKTEIEKNTERAIGTATITVSYGEYSDKCIIVVVPKLLIGEHIEHNISYTDMYSDYAFPTTEAWRVLDEGTFNSVDGTYSDTKLISTGIPLRVNYNSGSNPNNTDNSNSKWWATYEQVNQEYGLDLTKWESGNSRYFAAYGLKYNFTSIPLVCATSKDSNNSGFYVQVTNPEATTTDSGAIFETSKSKRVHALTLEELNTGINEASEQTTPRDLTCLDKITADIDPKALFYLRGLNNYGYTEDTTAPYWLGTPNTSASGVIRVRATGAFAGGTSDSYGIRVVITLNSKVYYNNGTWKIQ